MFYDIDNKDIDFAIEYRKNYHRRKSPRYQGDGRRSRGGQCLIEGCQVRSLHLLPTVKARRWS